MKRFISFYISKSPWVIFLPFLFVFIAIVLKFNNNTMQGDEGRYYQFAINLINGYYSPDPPNINLWNGPGYPLFLVPFVFFKMPLIAIKLSNAFLQYFSIIALFYAIHQYLPRNKSLLFAFFWAFYYVAYQELPCMLTEPLTSFLSALIVYFASKAFNSDSLLKDRLYLGITIGFLVLTKVIFGYVLISMLIIVLVVVIIVNTSNNRRLFFVLCIAFLVTIPYLFYTYRLTNKPFYFANSGGSCLYWMSTPVEGEFGDWNNESFTANSGNDPNIPDNSKLIAKNHQKDIDYISQYIGVKRDDAYKQIAFSNIYHHPVKYFRNCVSNLGRLFFSIPTSYFYQREQALVRFPPNSILLSMILFCSVPTFLNFRNNLPNAIKLVVGIIIFYFFFSMLVSAYPRQLYVIVPFLLFWFAYIVDRCVVVNFKIANQ